MGLEAVLPGPQNAFYVMLYYIGQLELYTLAYTNTNPNVHKT